MKDKQSTKLLESEMVGGRGGQVHRRRGCKSCGMKQTKKVNVEDLLQVVSTLAGHNREREGRCVFC